MEVSGTMIACIDPELNVADGVQLAHHRSEIDKTRLNLVLIAEFVRLRSFDQASVRRRTLR